MKTILIFTITTILGMHSVNAASMLCKTTNQLENRVEITATIGTKILMTDFNLKEIDMTSGIYGSQDPLLAGVEKGKYVRFTPRGFVNSSYRLAVPSNYTERNEFPLFLDTGYDGGQKFSRTLKCRLSK